MDPSTSAQDVTRCDMCETSIVQMYCDTCLVNLCKACVGDHISFDENRGHKVVNFQSRRTTPMYPDCAFHEQEQCEMYCRHCDVSVCPNCLASNRHLGHKLSKILQVLGEKKEFIRKEQIELKEKIYPTYHGIAADVQNRMSQLKNECGDLLISLANHREYWHSKTNNLVRKLKNQVRTIEASNLQSLQKYLNKINQTIFDIKAQIDLLEIAANSNDIETPFSVKLIAHNYKTLPHKKPLLVPTFTPEAIQEEELLKLFGFFHPLPEIGCRRPVKRLIEHPYMAEKMLTMSGLPQNVAYVKNSKVWISKKSSTIKLHSIFQGSRLATIRTTSGNIPADIAVSRKGELIYIDDKDRTINIVKNTDIEEIIRLQDWKPRRVCCTTSGELLIIMEDNEKHSKIVRYFGSTEKQSIQFDDEGNALFSTSGSAKYVCENINLDICVADRRAKAVVVVNQTGKLRFRYNGHTPTPKFRSLCPKGIITDSQGHILICDKKNYCIHIINENGQFQRYICLYILESTDTMHGLCIDTRHNLFLIGNRLKFFKLSTFVGIVQYLR